MPNFSYKGFTSAGKPCKGTVEAESLHAARNKLKSSGKYVSDLSEIGQVRKRGSTSGDNNGKSFVSRLGAMRFGRGVSSAELADATKQLATLLRADIPLDTALDSMTAGMKPSVLLDTLSGVSSKIKAGESFADSLSDYPTVFPMAYEALARAGETTGTLPLVMTQLAEFERQRLLFKRKVKTSLAYPVLMALTGIVVVVFLLSYVVPKVTQIFVDYDKALPGPTRLLLSMSGFLREYWPFLALAAAGVAVGVWVYVRTPSGRLFMHRIVFRLPIAGKLIRNMALAKFSRTFGTLLHHEVPLLTALKISVTAVNNQVLADSMSLVGKEISEGESIVGPMSRYDVFPQPMLQMIAAGERSGTVDEMVLVVAETYEQEAAARLEVLTSLLEPVMILLLGVVVGFVVLAVLLPIFEMSHLVG